MPGPYAVRVRTPDGWQDIAMIGPQGVPGATGPAGPNGTAIVSEQPSAPASPVIGQLWIDTDESPPTTANTAEVIVTSLPTSPVDGQIVNYLADATNGVVWRLRYRSGSSSAYKWEFIGGAPLSSEVTTTQSLSSATYADLTTAGPTIIVPLAGDYDVGIGAYMATGTTVDTYMAMSYAIGGTAASDLDAIWHRTPGSAIAYQSAARNRRKPGLSATTNLISKYRAGGAYSMTWGYRWMTALPVRVG